MTKPKRSPSATTSSALTKSSWPTAPPAESATRSTSYRRHTTMAPKRKPAPPQPQLDFSARTPQRGDIVQRKGVAHTHRIVHISHHGKTVTLCLMQGGSPSTSSSAMSPLKLRVRSSCSSLIFRLDLGAVAIGGDRRECPLVEAVGGDDAASSSEEFAVGSGGGDGLCGGL
jgi:hypothetical protein